MLRSIDKQSGGEKIGYGGKEESFKPRVMDEESGDW